MDPGFTQFLDDVQDHRDVDTLRGALLKRFSEMGFPHFSYHLIRPQKGPRLPFVITNYPKSWARRYTEMDYVNIDPTISEATRSNMPFRWSELRGRRGTTVHQRRMFREVREAGLTEGGAIPVHGPGGSMAIVTVASSESGKTFERLWGEQKYELQLISFCTHEAVSNKLGPEAKPEYYHLSPRERECLVWAARGKTAWETGEILGTTERTIVFHFENATRKLGVHNKIHAVVKATMLGLILP